MFIDADEALEDYLDSVQFEVDIGDIWGDASNLYLVIQHEECGCVFTRAVSLNGSASYQLIAQRDEEIKTYFLDSGFEKMGHIDSLLADTPFYLDVKKIKVKTTKKTAKTKTSKKARR